MAWSNSNKVQVTGGLSYYTEYTTTNLYVEKPFGGAINEITVSNDSDDDPVQISWDGAASEVTYSGVALVELAADDDICIAIRNTTSADDVFTVHTGDLKVVMAGG